MGLFNRDSFKYVAAVTPEGKPILAKIKKGSCKGECNAKGYCQEHKTIEQWNAVNRPLWMTNPMFSQNDVETCTSCHGRIGYMGEIPGNKTPPCSCQTVSYKDYNTDKVIPWNESQEL